MSLRDRSFPTCQLPMEQWVKKFGCETFNCQQQTCAARPSPKGVESPSKKTHKALLQPSELPLRWKSPAGQSGRGSRRQGLPAVHAGVRRCRQFR
ncbi:hypothetical protein DUNSADRAFT_2949 [Dunaliella salina]|uniref:Encoded protein n=1 Tax=Dunaliella salina TaxID=3046 RepID=A0ABQ7FVT3_DUNSA|nr:hypothetical protein DUNSADRAFT_2949 [Dunaliella salina]|eukprot:KAF5826489.1 hypothetical protein DUNSADRAFT_2949 [Dunaliella salina]